MDMHVTVKRDNGRTWYAADSGRFWHTNRGVFDAWCESANVCLDGITFEVREYDPERKSAPKAITDRIADLENGVLEQSK